MEASIRMRNLFGIFTLISGALVSAGALTYLFDPYYVYSGDLGLLTPAALSVVFAQLLAVSLLLMTITALLMLPVLPKTERVLNALYLAAGLAGAVLAAEGLALINVSITSTDSFGSITMMLTGSQSFCLGGLAISGVIIAEDKPRLLKNAHGYTALMFLLLLLPAAFLLA